MNTQQAYEGIRAWFSRPEATLAYDQELGMCAYRVGREKGSNGRCAIGCLIPDDEYQEWFDSHDTSGGDVVKVVPALTGVDPEFLLVAQEQHDEADDPEHFLERLDDIARRYDLVVAA